MLARLAIIRLRLLLCLLLRLLCLLRLDLSLLDCKHLLLLNILWLAMRHLLSHVHSHVYRSHARICLLHGSQLRSIQPLSTIG